MSMYITKIIYYLLIPPLALVSIFTSLINQSIGHMCTHQVPKPHQFIHGVDIEPHHVMKKRSIDQNLRIKIVYDDSLNDLIDEQNQFIKNVVLPKAVEYWEKTLKVRQMTSKIRLLRECSSVYVRYKTGEPYHYCADGCANVTMCGDVQVPQAHLDHCRLCPKGPQCMIDESNGEQGEGVSDADFLLYVSTKNTERCGYGTTVAYAAYCQLEGALDRPVAGYVNICPSSISLKSHDITQVVSTIKHEILHALGFSAGLYAFYRDSNGNPLTPREPSSGKPKYNKRLEFYEWSDKVVKEITRTHWKTRNGVIERKVQMLVTPRVVKEVRRHYNCSSLEGAELENQGIVGTALTHWEKRVFENEAMTGTYTQNPLISRITLALMEDTGWFKADYRYAQDLQWGKNLGCDFVKKSCLSWMEKQRKKGSPIHPFCNRVKKSGSLMTECTDSLEAMALCNLVRYKEPLPQKYQYFSDIVSASPSYMGHFGGSVSLADYCPYIQEFNWRKGSKVVRGSRCGDAANQAAEQTNYAVETYGRESVCVEQALPWLLKECDRRHPVQHWGSGCYQFTCSETGISLIIHNTTYRCYKTGQHLAVKLVIKNFLHEGVLVCPSCEQVCETSEFTCPPDQDPPMKLETFAVEMSIPCRSCRVKLDLLAAVLILCLSSFKYL